MTEEEIEIVAHELAKAGGTSWYPGRERGTMLRVVTERYREQARVVIRTYDGLRAQQEVSHPLPPASLGNVVSHGGLMR